MARYIDAEEFCVAIIRWGEKRGAQFLANTLCECVDVVPTADVVPKSEVEKIFEEIETECQWHMDAYKYSSFGESIMRNVIKSIAELRKKYTEEK